MKVGSSTHWNFKRRREGYGDDPHRDGVESGAKYRLGKFVVVGTSHIERAKGEIDIQGFLDALDEMNREVQAAAKVFVKVARGFGITGAKPDSLFFPILFGFGVGLGKNDGWNE